ncbi:MULTISPECIES: glycogen debranching protein GlgX [unclassified Shewanella]|uniref:glycogen debranching protein GlgX n=1 Tax=unclassified Shewanella TaxID=196818 RepID=UPI001BC0B082|nr:MULTISPECIES: glycogen debranching protein GlgX [unclassified Shewanella]GIU09238.1 glycogen operon protein GlgX homolog [Shewanella sp. MBTL60-112-B1]GIU29106.1 glycogen operon protein GlgX homolog [Shewanella sp. MBTL60-112-B2]
MLQHQGFPYPLGATVDENGVNFALFSAHASQVWLCLFDQTGKHEIERIALKQQTHQVWHIYLQVADKELIYGYRVDGPYEPNMGHRFNPHKLLLDPYAKQWVGQFIEHDSHYAYYRGSEDADLSFDLRDNSEFMPKCKVVDIGNLKPIAPLVSPKSRLNQQHCSSQLTKIGGTQMPQSIIYELHVKGFSQQNEQIAPALRGRFLGLADDASIDYLSSLGITAVELMPVHSFISEAFLAEKQLSNYWGYNSLGFFAPHQDYLCDEGSGNIDEFRQMVSKLHQAGIEVLLDVVYNHSAEGNHLGPSLSFKGIDNLSYYRLLSNDKRFYINDTGCGNSLDISHPRVLQLVLDSLRYWVEVMGVDGFRFDLASSLGREPYGFDPGAGFFDAISQDPILSQVKLIAEPWDIGPGGYQLGGYPQLWSEWNDRYRDTLRRFWRGDLGLLPEFARRFHGSSDLFEGSLRGPAASINFITSHDGFSLQDLVSYSERHNLDNGEQNRDGHQENFSCNYGIEGETDDASIQALRNRQARNLLSCLLFSQGVPMLLSGDEMGHSQGGNNNAYCQDNCLTWLNWQLQPWQQQRLAFTTGLIALRKRFPLLGHKDFIHKDVLTQSSVSYGASHNTSHGGPATNMAIEHTDDNPSMSWFCRQAESMTKQLWTEGQTRSLSVMLCSELEELKGQRQALLLMLNTDEQALEFSFPTLSEFGHWRPLVDTYSGQINSPETAADLTQQSIVLQDRSLMLFYAQTKE